MQIAAFFMTDITDNKAENRYQWDIEGHLAVADYNRRGDQLAITHVGVPEALRNRGIAGKLMAFIVEDAKAQGLTIVPICSYAAAYMQRNK
jgi:predicted GNAT family acetyltransferase